MEDGGRQTLCAEAPLRLRSACPVPLLGLTARTISRIFGLGDSEGHDADRRGDGGDDGDDIDKDEEEKEEEEAGEAGAEEDDEHDDDNQNNDTNSQKKKKKKHRIISC